MIKLAYDKKADCLYACYYEETSADVERLVIQKLDMQGNLLYGNQGKRNEVLTQTNITLRDMTVSDAGDLIVVYTYMRDSFSGKHLLSAMRTSAEDGSAIWNETPLSSVESAKSEIACTAVIDNNHCIVAWHDERVVDSKDVYVQPIYLDGTLSDIENVGEDAVNCMTASYSGGVLNVSVCVDAPEHLKVDVYDISGRHVAQLCNENVAVGVHEYNATLSTGVYVVRVATSESVISTKVM